MSRDSRKKIIAEIEKLRGTRVLTYITGDRHPAVAQIGDDAVRPLYEQLRALGDVPKLDFFIYSRGGAIDVPWRLVTGLRTAAKEWAALIPFRANSAATLLALGADEIILGRNGELGPIDPSINFQTRGSVQQDSVSVEDVMAYVRFVRERTGLSDQAALAGSLAKLTERLDAVTLGNLYRTHSHIRDVARRMLLSRKSPETEQRTRSIIETLAERVYAHGHAVGLADAQDMGLPAKAASADLDVLMWSLLGEYENDMKLLEPIDPASVVAAQDTYSEQSTIAFIESTGAVHHHSGRVEISARRQLPPTLNVALNLNLPIVLPSGQPPPPALQAALQQLLQNAQQAILQEAQQAVQQALKAQAPLVGIEAAFRDGKWNRDA